MRVKERSILLIFILIVEVVVVWHFVRTDGPQQPGRCGEKKSLKENQQNIKVECQKKKKKGDINKKPCYRNTFQKHVIVMNFNYPHYEKAYILRDLYQDVFGVILTCGPRQNDTSKVGPDIVFEDRYWFLFRYLCLTLAIEKYPGYLGYLYSNDDLIINWWNLISFDVNRIWQSADVDWRQEAYKPIIVDSWVWWKHGIKACQIYYRRLKRHATSGNALFNKAYITYMRNGNGAPHCSKAWSDMFYIPGRYRNEYIKLSKLARKSNLMLEIAVGNILRSIDDEQNIESLHGLYLPDLGLKRTNKATVFLKYYNLNLTLIHPVKFNNKDTNLTLSLFRKFILPYKNILTQC